MIGMHPEKMIKSITEPFVKPLNQVAEDMGDVRELLLKIYNDQVQFHEQVYKLLKEK